VTARRHSPGLLALDDATARGGLHRHGRHALFTGRHSIARSSGWPTKRWRSPTPAPRGHAGRSDRPAYWMTSGDPGVVPTCSWPSRWRKAGYPVVKVATVPAGRRRDALDGGGRECSFFTDDPAALEYARTLPGYVDIRSNGTGPTSCSPRGGTSRWWVTSGWRASARRCAAMPDPPKWSGPGRFWFHRARVVRRPGGARHARRRTAAPHRVTSRAIAAPPTSRPGWWPGRPGPGRRRGRRAGDRLRIGAPAEATPRT